MIPRSMMTQHPDAASAYVSIQKEPDEAIDALLPQPRGLGLEEIMIDFEGKLTPYQQTAQIVLGLLQQGVTVGKQVKVTPRIPSGREEGVFRQLMALMSIVESNYKALKINGKLAIEEVVLPMTLEAAELVNLQERIADVVDLAHKEFGMSQDPVQIRSIPLVESIPAILKLKPMLRSYKKGLDKMGIKLKKMRLMTGRSDLALTYGMAAAVLANVIALSDMASLAEDGLQIFPILGGGTLPFRGNLNLENLSNTLKQYPSVQTYTIQSAMRYDHGRKKASELAVLLKKKAGRDTALLVDKFDKQTLINCIAIFAKNYLQTLKSALPAIIKVADLIPEQRDRLARKSEVGYARQLPQTKDLAGMVNDKTVAEQLGNLKFPHYELPRAISFTAALYTLGLPPEIIGTGSSIKEISQRYGQKGLNLIGKYYPTLATDVSAAVKYLYLPMGGSFFKPSFMKKIKSDISYIEEFLGIDSRPVDSLYCTILETLKPMLKQMVDGKPLSEEGLEYELVNELILKLGKLRKALG